METLTGSNIPPKNIEIYGQSIESEINACLGDLILYSKGQNEDDNLHKEVHIN